MPLRLKILALACVILLAFAITTALSAHLIRHVIGELSAIVDYHIELSSLISEIDVLTYEFELNLRRLIENSYRPEEIEASKARHREVAGRLPQIVDSAHKLVAQAIDDERNDLSDRVRLARLDGTLKLISRQIPPFVALGGEVLAALEAGRRDDARIRAKGFHVFEQPFGPDLAEARRAIALLTKDSTIETQGEESHVLWLNGVLFVVAAIFGLALFALLAQRLQQALVRLLEGTRSVEAGQLLVELPVTSRDEIGQLTTGFNRMIGELRNKARIQDTFGKYLDPRIVANLLGANSGNPEAAERRVVTIFFSDIKGFSGLSEQLTADVMVRLLNGYFSAVTRIIREQNGVVDKFIGDAVMAFWAPPFSPGDQHAPQACLAALAQQAALPEFRRQLSDLTGLRRNVPDFQVRMGLATGEVVVGSMGSDTTKTYTVIGDTVNVASRLEGVNKAYGTRIIAAEDTLRLAQHAVEARELDLVIVAGKTEPIRVFELLAPAGQLKPEVARAAPRVRGGPGGVPRHEVGHRRAEVPGVPDALPRRRPVPRVHRACGDAAQPPAGRRLERRLDGQQVAPERGPPSPA
jgi:adenylate cyclase